MSVTMLVLAALASLGGSGAVGWALGVRKGRRSALEALHASMQLTETTSALLSESNGAMGRAADELAALKDELARRRESHEVVVGALLKERDAWHGLYKKTEADFADTMAYYESKIQELGVLAQRDFMRQTEAERVSRRERWNALVKGAPRRDYDVVKDEAGVSILVSKPPHAASDPGQPWRTP